MRGQHLMIMAVPLAGIAALAAVAWPSVRDPSLGLHAEEVKTSVALARDLKEMRTSADEHLARAAALVEEFRRSREEAPRVAASPFVLPPPPQPPLAAAPIEPETPAEAAAAPPPAPLPSPPVELPPMRLTGVLLAGPDSLAVIDGEVRRPGEVIAGFRLAEVRPDGVIFVHAETGQQHTLPLTGWDEGGRASAGSRTREGSP